MLDLLLAGETADDAALASALAAAVNPSIALSLMDGGTPPSGPIADKIADSSFALARNPVPAGPKGILGPEYSFAQHAQLGHVKLMLEDDGALRRIPVALRLGDQGPVLPSLAVVAARLGGTDRKSGSGDPRPGSRFTAHDHRALLTEHRAPIQNSWHRLTWHLHLHGARGEAITALTQRFAAKATKPVTSR